MINFLAKIFIKDYRDIDRASVQSKYISLSGLVGLGLNIFLFIIKFIVGKLTGSIALTSDAFNNLSDSLTSLVAVIGSIAARKPADQEHPQGHGRIEYLASLIVGVLIMFMGLSLFFDGVREVRNPTATDFSLAFIGVLIVSNLVKFYMYKYNKDLSIRLDSPLNDGVAKDSLSDTIATTGILITGIISYFTGYRLDGITGILISALVFKTGLDFTLETSSTLLGRKVSDDLEEKIVKEIEKGKHIKGYHDLYIHDYGRGNIIAHAHVEVPGNISVFEMSQVIDQVESSVNIKYGVLLVLHMDPRFELTNFDEDAETLVVDLTSEDDIDPYIQKAADLINKGELVVVPTETVYGLAGDGLNPMAVEKIFKAKERSNKNPLILHIASKEEVNKLAIDVPDLAYKLMDEFWPGPLTLVLNKSPLVPYQVTAGTETVGLRMPDNDIISQVIRASGKPLACPSANKSGRPSPTNIVDVYEDMKGRVGLILGDGSTKLGLESTIVDLTGKPSVLRLGYYDLDTLRKLIPGLEYNENESEVYSKAQKISHYKTKADIIVYSDSLPNLKKKMSEDIKSYKDQGMKVGILTSYEDSQGLDADYIFSYGSKYDKEEIARILFSKLRDFDRLDVDKILVQGVDEKGIGRTIMSRLEKASEGRIIN